MKTITVDFSRSAGAVKAMHGIGNGPFGRGYAVDTSHYYKEAGIPYVRLHDTNWPHPREVDIPQIFPDEDADPDDPASYDFRRTDFHLQGILNCGAKIVYRLGVSIEHTPQKYFTHPPKDPAKWAKVCTNIIRHYNEGWANGHHHGIEYWEIWNEPDIGPLMWSGTFDQYMELYAHTSKAIKAAVPSVKVGGYAAASGLWECNEFSPMKFLERVRAEKLPLDFYSWHRYSVGRGPLVFADMGRKVRKMLDDYGFTSTESHLNEWNIATFRHHPGQEYLRRQGRERSQGEVGASFVATVFITLQDACVDVANYYIGEVTSAFCGPFDLGGAPMKTYESFKAFNKLVMLKERVAVEKAEQEDEIACLGAADAARANGAILLAKYGGGLLGQYSLEIKGLPKGKERSLEILVIDEFRNLEPYRPRIAPVPTEEGFSVNLELLEHSVALVQLR